MFVDRKVPSLAELKTHTPELSHSQNLKKKEVLKGNEFEDTPEGRIAFYHAWLEANNQLFQFPEVIAEIDSLVSGMNKELTQEKHREFFEILSSYIKSGISFDEALKNTISYFLSSLPDGIPENAVFSGKFEGLPVSENTFLDEAQKLIKVTHKDTELSQAEALKSNKDFQELISQTLQLQPKIAELLQQVEQTLKVYIAQECMNTDGVSFSGKSKTKVDAIKRVLSEKKGEIAHIKNVLLGVVWFATLVYGLTAATRMNAPTAELVNSVWFPQQAWSFIENLLSGKVSLWTILVGASPSTLAFFSKKNWMKRYDIERNKGATNGDAVIRAFAPKFPEGSTVQGKIRHAVTHTGRAALFGGAMLATAIGAGAGAVSGLMARDAKLDAIRGFVAGEYNKSGDSQSESSMGIGESVGVFAKAVSATIIGKHQPSKDAAIALQDAILDPERGIGVADIMGGMLDNKKRVDENIRSIGRSAIQGLMFEVRGEARSGLPAGFANASEEKLNAIISALAPDLKLSLSSQGWEQDVNTVMHYFYNGTPYAEHAKSLRVEAEKQAQYVARLQIEALGLPQGEKREAIMKKSSQIAEQMRVLIATAEKQEKIAENLYQAAEQTAKQIIQAKKGDRKITIIPFSHKTQEITLAAAEIEDITAKWQNILSQLEQANPDSVTYDNLIVLASGLDADVKALENAMNTYNGLKLEEAKQLKAMIDQIDKRISGGVSHGKEFAIKSTLEKLEAQASHIEAKSFHLSDALKKMQLAEMDYDATNLVEPVLVVFTLSLLIALLSDSVDILGGTALNARNRRRNPKMLENIDRRMTLVYGVGGMKDVFEEMISALKAGNQELIDASLNNLQKILSIIQSMGKIRDELDFKTDPRLGYTFVRKNKTQEQPDLQNMHKVREHMQKYGYLKEHNLDGVHLIQEIQEGRVYSKDMVLFIPRIPVGKKYVHIPGDNGTYTVEVVSDYQSKNRTRNAHSLMINHKGVFAISSREEDGKRIPYIINVLS